MINMDYTKRRYLSFRTNAFEKEKKKYSEMDINAKFYDDFVDQ